jgi:hypothetical protein
MRPKITELELRAIEIEETELTPEEIKYALWSAKCQKWNRERNAEYWAEQERKKSKES